MTDGRYVYCILDGDKEVNFRGIGLMGKDAYTTSYSDIRAVISNLPFGEVRPSLENITAHQRVVEESRKMGPTLPVRFGTLFKTKEGVKTLLEESYEDFKPKINKFRGKDEFGVKILLNQDAMKRIRHGIKDGSENLRELRKELSRAGEGKSYFLKMKLDEAVTTETLKAVEQINEKVHKSLGEYAEDSRILKSDFEYIILNAAYLVDQTNQGKFELKIAELKKHFSHEGLSFHLSGPWAPYSFC